MITKRINNKNKNYFSLGSWLNTGSKKDEVKGALGLTKTGMGKASSMLKGATTSFNTIFNPKGNTSGVGNIIGGLAPAVSSIPIFGDLAGAGIEAIAGLTNTMFGSKINQEAVDKYTNQATMQGSTKIDTTDTSSMLDLWNDKTNMNTVKLSDIGSDGWFSNKAQNKTDEINNLISLNNNRNTAALVEGSNIADTVLDSTAAANFAAYGGLLNNRKSSFNNRYDTGGNIYTKKNKDYTSNLTGMMKARMAIDSHFGNKTARRMTNYDTRNIPLDNGDVGNVYVSSYDNLVTPQIQDKGNSKLEFINDVWSKENRDDSYNQSMKFENAKDAQYFGEHYKEIAPMMNLYNKQYSEGGNLNIDSTFKGQHGGNFTNGVTSINKGGTHESNPNEGVPMGKDAEGTPNLVEEGEVKFKDYIFSNRLKPTKASLVKAKIDKYYGKSYADIAKIVSKESEERPNDPISKNGLYNSLQILQELQESRRQEDMLKQMSPRDLNMLQQAMMEQQAIPQEQQEQPIEQPQEQQDISQQQGEPNLFEDGGNTSKESQPKLKFDFDYSKPVYPTQTNFLYNTMPTFDSIKYTVKPSTKVKPQNKFRNFIDKYVVDLRYAPVVGSLTNVATDLLGLTNTPDYTNANAILNSTKNLKELTHNPLGNYLAYNPLDTEFQINKLNANSSANRRALLENSGGNKGVAAAGILASDYNYGNQLGDLTRQAAEYNNIQKQRVEEFNRGTNQYNADSRFKVDMANKANEEARLRALVASSELRDKQDIYSSTNKSTNLTNLFNNIGNVGWEEYNRNMVNSGDYTTDSSGNTWYKGRIVSRKNNNTQSKSLGGYLTIKNKRRK